MVYRCVHWKANTRTGGGNPIPNCTFLHIHGRVYAKESLSSDDRGIHYYLYVDQRLRKAQELKIDTGELSHFLFFGTYSDLQYDVQI
jgi:hypothetical protein